MKSVFFFDLVLAGALLLTACLAVAQEQGQLDSYNVHANRQIAVGEPIAQYELIRQAQIKAAAAAAAAAAKEDENENKTLITEPYSVGALDGHAHDVDGEVLIVDEKTIQIHGFDFDGRGPNAYFVLGYLPPLKPGNENETAEPAPLPEYADVDETMVVIPDDGGICEPLSLYRDKDFTLKIPGPKNVSDFSYLSVYAVQEGHNYGSVSWPDDIRFKKGSSILGILECSISRALVADTAKSERAPPTIFQAVNQVINVLDHQVDSLGTVIDAII